MEPPPNPPLIDRSAHTDAKCQLALRCLTAGCVPCHQAYFAYPVTFPSQIVPQHPSRQAKGDQIPSGL